MAGRVHITLQPGILAELDRICAERRMTRTAAIQWAVERWIDWNRAAAMAEFDAPNSAERGRV